MRAALAIGLGLVGVAGLVAPSRAQQGQDAGVRQAAGNANAAAATQAKIPQAPPAVIGTIDLEQIVSNYDGYKAGLEQVEAESMARYKEMMSLQSEGTAEMEKLKKLAPGSPDQKKIEERLTEIKVKMQAIKEQAQMEISRREAEIMANIYAEVQQLTAGIAKQRGINLVVQASTTPPTASNPKTVEMAMFRTVVWVNPEAKIDLTHDVTQWLNYYYKKQGRPAPKGREAAQAGAAGNAAGGTGAAATPAAAAGTPAGGATRR